MKGRYASDELQGVWKYAVVAYFKVLYLNLPAKTEKTHENLRIPGLRAEI
jgi:hypothetical protein